jgi:hypothetical protein
VEYEREMKRDESLPDLQAGTHYRVIDTPDSDYVVFPDDAYTRVVRHYWVLVRYNRPHVPKPMATPLVRKNMDNEKKFQIFNVYLRPWVNVAKYAKPHVPHVDDLDLPITRVLEGKHVRRLITKTPPLVTQDRSYEGHFLYTYFRFHLCHSLHPHRQDKLIMNASIRLQSKS